MATHIKDIVNDFFKQKSTQHAEIEKINNLVNTTLETQLKKHVRFNGVYDNKLIFYSNVSSARYDFNLKKDTLLKKVQKEFPYIEGITVKMGS